MTFDPGLLRFSQSATTQARSYGPGGQRYGEAGIVITKVPPAGMASSWLRSVVVSGPACHACTTLLRAASLSSPGRTSNTTPGATIRRS